MGLYLVWEELQQLDRRRQTARPRRRGAAGRISAPPSAPPTTRRPVAEDLAILVEGRHFGVDVLVDTPLRPPAPPRSATTVAVPAGTLHVVIPAPPPRQLQPPDSDWEDAEEGNSGEQVRRYTSFIGAVPTAQRPVTSGAHDKAEHSDSADCRVCQRYTSHMTRLRPAQEALMHMKYRQSVLYYFREKTGTNRNQLRNAHSSPARQNPRGGGARQGAEVSQEKRGGVTPVTVHVPDGRQTPRTEPLTAWSSSSPPRPTSDSPREHVPLEDGQRVSQDKPRPRPLQAPPSAQTSANRQASLETSGKVTVTAPANAYPAADVTPVRVHLHDVVTSLVMPAVPEVTEEEVASVLQVVISQSKRDAAAMVDLDAPGEGEGEGEGKQGEEEEEDPGSPAKQKSEDPFPFPHPFSYSQGQIAQAQDSRQVAFALQSESGNKDAGKTSTRLSCSNPKSQQTSDSRPRQPRAKKKARPRQDADGRKSTKRRAGTEGATSGSQGKTSRGKGGEGLRRRPSKRSVQTTPTAEPDLALEPIPVTEEPSQPEPESEDTPIEEPTEPAGRRRSRVPVVKKERVPTVRNWRGRPLPQSPVPSPPPSPLSQASRGWSFPDDSEEEGSPTPADSPELEASVQVLAPDLPDSAREEAAEEEEAEAGSPLREVLVGPRARRGQVEERRWGPRRRDSTYREELRRQELAEERRKKQQALYSRLKTSRMLSTDLDADEDQGANAAFDDYGFLAKYCIFNRNNLLMYKRAFDAVDDGNRGTLTGPETMIALRGVNNHLTDAEEEYVYRVMEMTGYKLQSGTDFKLFSVLAALSQKITMLDDWMRNAIGSMDFKTLEMKMFLCKRLWECNVEEATNTMPLEQLLVELRAGGVSPEHEREVRHKLTGLTSLDLLDFLSYVPLFIMIHQSVVDNPLDTSRSK